MSQLAETAELVVSELCTNAVQASYERVVHPRLGLPVMHLHLLSDGERLAIEVWDTNPKKPVAIYPSEDDESGRGLMLVEAVSARWGSDTVPGWSGKVVWAELTLGTT